MLVPVAPALNFCQHGVVSERSKTTYAELVEVVLVFEVVDDEFTLVDDVEVVEALLEVVLVDDLTVDVDSVVELEVAFVEVDVAPLAVAVAEGNDPEGAP